MAAQRECKTASANVSVRSSGRGRTAKVSDNLYINNRLVNKCMPTQLNANANASLDSSANANANVIFQERIQMQMQMFWLHICKCI